VVVIGGGWGDVVKENVYSVIEVEEYPGGIMGIGEKEEATLYATVLLK
jgi:hypothetical protein